MGETLIKLHGKNYRQMRKSEDKKKISDLQIENGALKSEIDYLNDKIIKLESAIALHDFYRVNLYKILKHINNISAKTEILFGDHKNKSSMLKYLKDLKQNI